MLTIKQLEHVIALETYRSFSLGASAVGITQSALTQSIQKIEDDLGVTLFERTRGGVTPTAFGEQTIALAHSLMDQMSSFRREVGLLKQGKSGHLIVGCDTLISEALLGPSLVMMHEKYPDLRFSTHIGGWSDLLEELLEKRIDIYIGSPLERVDERIRTIDLSVPYMTLFCRTDHPLAKKKNPTRKECLEYPIAGTPRPGWYYDWFISQMPADADIDYKAIHPYFLEAQDYGTIRWVVRNTDAVAAGLYSLIQEDVEAGRLHKLDVEGFDFPLPAVIATLSTRPISLPASLFIKSVTDIAAKGMT